MSDGIEIGKVYTGKVKKIMEYGAFVNILPGKDGLVHISQISEERVNNVRDVMAEGDDVQVKVLDIDGQGRVKLTMKDVG
jgi:polyribonucleotide nucleotidyltransferase